MVIEGVAFVLTIAAYFFLMSHEQHWAPGAIKPPDPLAGTLFTLVILLSEYPNTLIKKAAEVYDVATVRRLLPRKGAIDWSSFLVLIVLGFLWRAF
jgi:heme/copper-type cytochrome/quinol oxidase subunit 3